MDGDIHTAPPGSPSPLSLTHTNTQALSITHTHTDTNTQALSLAVSHTQTMIQTHSPPSPPPPPRLSLSLSNTHTQMQTHRLPPLSQIQAHRTIKPVILFLSHAHTHCRTHTHTVGPARLGSWGDRVRQLTWHGRYDPGHNFFHCLARNFTHLDVTVYTFFAVSLMS